jgi:hypothetical protein
MIEEEAFLVSSKIYAARKNGGVLQEFCRT